MKRIARCAACLAIFSCCFIGFAGCGTAWSPAPPRGQTWSYARQGGKHTSIFVDTERVGNWQITRGSRTVTRTHGPVAQGSVLPAPSALIDATGSRPLDPSPLARRALRAARSEQHAENR